MALGSNNKYVSAADRIAWDAAAGGGVSGPVTSVVGGLPLFNDVTGDSLSQLSPSAIRFIKINADNTVTARTAADFRTDISTIEVSGVAKITVGTSAPVGPSVGDLWVDIS